MEPPNNMKTKPEGKPCRLTTPRRQMDTQEHGQQGHDTSVTDVSTGSGQVAGYGQKLRKRLEHSNIGWNTWTQKEFWILTQTENTATNAQGAGS